MLKSQNKEHKLVQQTKPLALPLQHRYASVNLQQITAVPQHMGRHPHNMGYPNILG